MENDTDNVEIDTDKIDDTILAPLCLTMHDDLGEEFGARAWKGHDWAATDRLFEKGLIGDPRGKSKSLLLTPKGKKKALELFSRMFEKKNKKVGK